MAHPGRLRSESNGTRRDWSQPSPWRDVSATSAPFTLQNTHETSPVNISQSAGGVTSPLSTDPDTSRSPPFSPFSLPPLQSSLSSLVSPTMPNHMSSIPGMAAGVSNSGEDTLQDRWSNEGIQQNQRQHYTMREDSSAGSLNQDSLLGQSIWSGSQGSGVSSGLQRGNVASPGMRLPHQPHGGQGDASLDQMAMMFESANMGPTHDGGLSSRQGQSRGAMNGSGNGSTPFTPMHRGYLAATGSNTDAFAYQQSQPQQHFRAPQAQQFQHQHAPRFPNHSQHPSHQSASASTLAPESNRGNELITTVFIVGFPDDMTERELNNMFTFAKGFENAALKVPFGNQASGAGAGVGSGTGAGGPYNAVTLSGPNGGVDGSNEWEDDMMSSAASRSANNGDAYASLPGMGGPPGGQNGAGANGKGKQTIAFARFRTLADADEAREFLNGRKIDVDKGCVLKTEMARKNLHSKHRPGIASSSNAPTEATSSMSGPLSGGSFIPHGLATAPHQVTSSSNAFAGPHAQGALATTYPRDASGMPNERSALSSSQDASLTARSPPYAAGSDQLMSNGRNGSMQAARSAAASGLASFAPLQSQPFFQPQDPRTVSQVDGRQPLETAQAMRGDESAGRWGTAAANVREQGGLQEASRFPSRAEPVPAPHQREPQRSSITSPGGFTGAQSSVPISAPSTATTFPMQGGRERSESSGNGNARSFEARPEDFGQGEPTASARVASWTPSSTMLPDYGTEMRHDHREAGADNVIAGVAPTLQTGNAARTLSLATSPSARPQPPLGSLRIDSPNLVQSRQSRPFSPSNALRSPSLNDGHVLSPGLHASAFFRATSPGSPTISSPNSRSFSLDTNPPGNTLFVGNLPASITSPPASTQLEEALRRVFSQNKGYKTISFRIKESGPMCFVEFEDVGSAGRALSATNGHVLDGMVKGGLRLSFSKHPLFRGTSSSACSSAGHNRSNAATPLPTTPANEVGNVFGNSNYSSPPRDETARGRAGTGGRAIGR